LRKKAIKFCIWSTALYGVETWTLRKIDWKYLASCEIWYYRRTEKISWTIRGRNEVLIRVKEERNILDTIKQRKANWIGYALRKNCFLIHVIGRKKG
jgi:hypothetical protein